MASTGNAVVSDPVASTQSAFVDGSFSLTDHHGKAVTAQSYRGRHVLLFFGFTHCRVVCPRNLAKLSKALDSLGSLADRVQPLYVTVDPARDTPEVMKAFLEQNYPRFTGLTGSAEQIEQAKKSFRVFAKRKEDATDPDGYVVPHTAFTYVLGPTGSYLAHFSDGVSESELAQRLRALIEI